MLAAIGRIYAQLKQYNRKNICVTAYKCSDTDLTNVLSLNLFFLFTDHLYRHLLVDKVWELPTILGHQLIDKVWELLTIFGILPIIILHGVLPYSLDSQNWKNIPAVHVCNIVYLVSNYVHGYTECVVLNICVYIYCMLRWYMYLVYISMVLL
jgi:hypothetical protein